MSGVCQTHVSVGRHVVVVLRQFLPYIQSGLHFAVFVQGRPRSLQALHELRRFHVNCQSGTVQTR